MQATAAAAAILAANHSSTAATQQPNFQILAQNMNGLFLIVMGSLIFLMHFGFAFLEAGSVRYTQRGLIYTLEVLLGAYNIVILPSTTNYGRITLLYNSTYILEIGKICDNFINMNEVRSSNIHSATQKHEYRHLFSL